LIYLNCAEPILASRHLFTAETLLGKYQMTDQVVVLRNSNGWRIESQAFFAAVPLVSYWHKADIKIALPNVRFRGQSGHPAALSPCLLLTQKRTSHHLVKWHIA
jgi:hypothetical protein